MTKAELLLLLDELIEASPGTLKGDEELENLSGWDSATIIEYMALFDSKFGVTPSIDSLMKCKTVSDLIRLAGEHISG